LNNKVFDIIDALCNHEVQFTGHFAKEHKTYSLC